ncbi:MAG: GNAT family N-acetyltransferase [Planctomycetota bacterium]|jgi:diamine N-acetyltransferase
MTPDPIRSEAGPQAVSLREITRETLGPILELATTAAQERFVASNAVSLAQAHFAPEAWYRAIYAGEEPVGFLMLSDKPEAQEYFLWRFMIGADHQRRGYGRRALELLIEHVRSRPGATELLLSFVPGEGSPEAFYRKCGFEHTGRVEHDELVMRLPL